MFKKTLVLGGVVALLLGWFGRSHVMTTVGMVKESVKDSVPVGFEIKRARQMIKDLQPEIERNMHVIAREETEVAKLERQLTSLEGTLAKDRDDILRLKKDLDKGSETFVYAGRSYTAKQVSLDLQNRFDQFKTQEATTGSLKKILDARQKGLQAAREKLEGMLAAKRQLEVDVESLEARVKMVEVAETTSNFNFDDSQLSRTKELVQQIGDRIEVAERLVNADTKLHDRIPLDKPAGVDRDIKGEVANYFSQEPSNTEALADSQK
jgi:chromosome segregation ATPase